MIRHDVIEWLIKKMLVLDEWDYLAKHCLLLLMSLTRYRSGQQNCIELSNDVVQFSTKFLSGAYKVSTD